MREEKELMEFSRCFVVSSFVSIVVISMQVYGLSTDFCSVIVSNR